MTGHTQADATNVLTDQGAFKSTPPHSRRVEDSHVVDTLGCLARIAEVLAHDLAADSVTAPNVHADDRRALAHLLSGLVDDLRGAVAATATDRRTVIDDVVLEVVLARQVTAVTALVSDVVPVVEAIE